MRLKTAERVSNSVAHDQASHSVATDLDLHCLLRPVCPNTQGKYGPVFCITKKAVLQ